MANLSSLNSTQTFDHADLTYFFPLMAQAEQRLGHKPKFGTFDAAFDAWYVYAYFHSTCEESPAGGFAAVPSPRRVAKPSKIVSFLPTVCPFANFYCSLCASSSTNWVNTSARSCPANAKASWAWVRPYFTPRS